MRIRLILAIIACKLAVFFSRILGKMGTSMPGHLAMMICPDLLSLLSNQIKKEIVVVCGTNGKTTTNNLLSSFIASNGYRVVCNDKGANMIWGICCAFAEKTKISGRLDADYACLEVDEASTVKVLRYIKPTKMVVTNLFRDQLDRYGTVELTLDYIKRALDLSPDTQLILNADDPVVAQLGEKTDRVCKYVGVDENTGIPSDSNSEGRFCMLCGTRLNYEYIHYSQLGKFCCPGCGFKRHTPDFCVRCVDLSDGVSFELRYDEKSIPFSIQYRGFYNIYNIALAYSAAVLCMEQPIDHQKVLSAYQPQIGRMEEFTIGGKSVILNLAKNPAGFNQAISAVMTDVREKNLLLAVNDNPSDGQDISWLWDVAFEQLKEGNIRTVVVTGIRADELFLRLKYAGFSTERIQKMNQYKEAVEILLSGDGEISYGLANYTSVFPIQAIVKEMAKGE